MIQIILGLGSNMGDRMAMLRQSLLLLSGYMQDMRCSPVYASPALLPENAPDDWNIPFLNMAVRGMTSLSAEEWLRIVKRIEQDMGRQLRGHWGPREIDIDVLAYGDTVIQWPDLCIPHKELLNRNFALMPLADIAPDWKYPVPGHYFAKAAQELVQAKGMRTGDEFTVYAQPLVLG